MIDVYGDGWNSLVYVQKAEKSKKYKGSYKLTFWVPEEYLYNFFDGVVDNRIDFQIDHFI